MGNWVSENIEKYSDMTNEFLQKDYNELGKLTKKNFGSVYLILHPTREYLLYVGQTSDLSKRLQQHISNPQPSNLNQKIKQIPSYPKDVSTYLVIYQKMESIIERFYFEHFLIAVLQTKFNDG